MTSTKRKIWLLACLLMIFWMVAGYIGGSVYLMGKANLPDSGAPASSSMSATRTDFDYMEAGNYPKLKQITQEPFRLQFAKPRLFVMVVVTAALLTCVILRLKLFQAIYLPFNFNRIPAFLHDKDGMK